MVDQNNIQFLKLIQPNILQTIIKNLYNPQFQKNLDKFGQQLQNYLSELSQLKFIFNQNQKQNLMFMRQTQASLSTISYNLQQQAQAQEKLNDLIKKIFLLEHQILDLLSEGQTATTSYRIYYNEGTVIKEFNISAEELYKNGGLTASPNGIKLYLSSIEKLIRNNHGTVETIDLQKWEQLAEIAINKLQNIFDYLRKEYYKVAKEYRKEHLGKERYDRFVRLRTIFEKTHKNYEQDIKNLKARLTVQVAKDSNGNIVNNYVSLKGLMINRGHIGEAYARWEESLAKSNEINLSSLLEESMGNLPWFAGGDVGSIQVKTFLNDKEIKSNWTPQVQIANIASIVNLGNEIYILIISRRQLLQEIPDISKNILQEKANDLDNKVTNAVLNEIDKLVKDSFAFK